MKEKISVKTLFCIVSALCLFSSVSVTAQSKIKDGSAVGSSSLPNSNAILELESSSKGFLLPRLGLSNTTLAAPLSAHIAGMVVYDTATAGDVSPGYYYNNGTKWVRLADAALADLSKDAWVDDNANTMVKLGTLSNGTTTRTAGTEMVIKDNGKVGVATSAPTAYLDINNPLADSTGLRIRSLSNSSNKQDKQIAYTRLTSPVYVDNNGRLYKKTNPVLSATSATTFDTTKAIWNDSTVASADLVSLSGGSVAGAGIIRFQMYEESMFFGVSGVGANLYADITYSWSNGFVVNSFGSSAGGASSNLVTVIGGNGDGSQRLEFRYAFGDANVVVKNVGGKSGTLRVFYVGADRGTIDTEFFQTFKSR